MILDAAKMSIPVNTTAYDMIIAQLISAAVSDLQIAGVPIWGVKVNVQTGVNGVVSVTDESTLTDPMLIRAICAYVRAHFGSPADYDRLKACYDENKAQLQTASGYGLVGGDV